MENFIKKEEAYEKVKKLIERFEENYAEFHKAEYNETLTRQDFINPFFKAFNWDIDNKKGYSQVYREVIHEDKIKVGRETKAPDYSFRIAGKIVFFVEAKKPNVNIEDNIAPAYQLRRYGWSAKLGISILTDFEELAIYDCTKKPNEHDKSSIARIKYINYKDYLKEFDFLWNLFNQEEILKGSLEKYTATIKDKKGTGGVDSEFLSSLDDFRKILAVDISKNNKNLSEEDINYAVQQAIDRIIFLRIAEDREIEKYGELKEACEKGNYYENLYRIFLRADDKYNSGLFDFKKDVISKNLKVDNKVVKDIITNLYYPKSPYEFSVLPVEILGSAYEQFLGKTITISSTGRVKIEEKPEVRKAGGVYYTPEYIVDYIVENTVGELVKNKSPKEIAKIKIVDPACGSGSFLLGAYKYLLDYYKEYYTKNNVKFTGKKDDVITLTGQLTTRVKKQILINNIYGVDIDLNAVEVTKLSLLLKCLEGETKQSMEYERSLFNERALPSLEENIKCGNSLIGTDFYSNNLNLDDEIKYKINCFDWNIEFAQVFKDGGFDIVIGNPPYVDFRLLSKLEIEYLKNKFVSTQVKEKWSLYILFIELGKNVLKENAIYGMIVPNTFLSASFGLEIRRLLIKEKNVREILDVSNINVFRNIGTYPVLLFYENRFQNANSILVSIANDEDLKNLKKSKISQNEIRKNNDKYIISLTSNKKEIKIIRKLTLSKLKLSDIASIFHWGTSISGFKSYKIYEEKYNTLSEKQKYKYFKVIQTADIKSYGINWKNEYINKKIYSSNTIEHFNQRKIVIARLTKNIQATIDNEFYFLGKSSYIISDEINYNFLIGLLNSKVLNFYFKHRFETTHLSGGYLRFDIPYLKQLPIPNLDLNIKDDKTKHDKLVALVDKMLELNKKIKTLNSLHEKDVLTREINSTDKEIDKIVYTLYGLTEEEVRVVDGE